LHLLIDYCQKVREAVLINLGEKGVYFVSALSEGKGFIEAIETANKAAAISVTKKGAQPSIPTINNVNNT